MDELISIIIPVYKVEKFLNQCIDSVINQTYNNIEIILIDDGSPDNCGKICDDYEKKDSRIRVIHKQNGGLSDARNAGLAVAQGEYIGFVDSDDYISYDMYEKLYSSIKRHKAQLAVCSFQYINEDGLLIYNPSPVKNERLSRIEALQKLNEPIWWYYVTAWNKLYSKELFSNICFPIEKIHEDAYVVHEIIGECNLVVTISEKLYYYRQRNNSIIKSSKTVRNYDAIEALCNRCDYYNQLGYYNLIKGTVCVLKDEFDSLYSMVVPVNKNDFERIDTLRKRFAKLFFIYNKEFGIKEYLRYKMPCKMFFWLKRHKN